MFYTGYRLKLRGGANNSYIRSFTYELLNTAAGRAAQDGLDPVYGTNLKSSFTFFISVSFVAKNCEYTDTSVALMNGIPTFYFPCTQVWVARERAAPCSAAAAGYHHSLTRQQGAPPSTT